MRQSPRPALAVGIVDGVLLETFSTAAGERDYIAHARAVLREMRSALGR
jgi:hypothetical protein